MMKVKCPNPECKYEWDTNSKMIFVTCPNCQKKFRRGVSPKVAISIFKGVNNRIKKLERINKGKSIEVYYSNLLSLYENTKFLEDKNYDKGLDEDFDKIRELMKDKRNRDFKILKKLDKIKKRLLDSTKNKGIFLIKT